MKKLFTMVLSFLFIGNIAVGATFLEEVDKSLKQGKLEKFLDEFKVPLRSKNEDAYEAQLKKLKLAVTNQIQEGDVSFSFKVLSDVILDTAKKTSAIDEDVKEDALDIITSYVNNNDSPNLSNREIGIYFLGKIATADKISNQDYRETAAKILLEQATSSHIVIAHAALMELSELAVKNGKDWSDLANDAASKIGSLLRSDDVELQRITFLELIDTLNKVKLKTEASVILWEKLTDSLDEIKSPALQKAVKKQVARLINKKRGSAFDKLSKEAKEELESLDTLKQNNDDTFEELLVQIKDEKSPVEYETMLDRILSQTQNNRDQQFNVYSKIAGYAASPNITSYKLRVYCNTIIELTKRIDSPLFFYQTATNFLVLTAIHQDKDLANIPVMKLGNLLTSTNSEVLINPILSEMTRLSSQLPLWIQRRIATLLFIESGDSANYKISAHAFNLFSDLGKNGRKKAIRWEVGQRIKLQAKLAKDERIKKMAMNWK